MSNDMTANMSTIAAIPKLAQSRNLTINRSTIIRATGPLVFAIPYLVLATLTTHSSFVALEHARVISNVLIAIDQGAINATTIEMPPLVSIIAFLHPSLYFVRIAAALAAGAATWVVWRQLQDAPLPQWLRIQLLASFSLAPFLLFQGSAQLSEMLASLLILISWRYYTRFIYLRITWNGFAAGLILALAFFANFAAVFFVIPFALAAPATLLKGQRMASHERWQANIAGTLVIAFPAVFSLIAWCYVDWTFTGEAFGIFTEREGPFSIFEDPSVQALTGISNALSAAIDELARVPLYPLMAILIARRGPRALTAYFFPLLLITAIRCVGLPFRESFSLTVYLGFALVAIVVAVSRPIGKPSNWRMTSIFFLLSVAAALQIVVNFTVPLQTAEAVTWDKTVLHNNGSEDDKVAKQTAVFIAKLKPDSVLADHSSAYRSIALSGTAKPYLISSDAKFDLALSDPANWVDHILLATTPSATDRLYPRFSGEVPGFSSDVEWDGWRLLTRNGAKEISGTLSP